MNRWWLFGTDLTWEAEERPRPGLDVVDAELIRAALCSHASSHAPFVGGTAGRVTALIERFDALIEHLHEHEYVPGAPVASGRPMSHVAFAALGHLVGTGDTLTTFELSRHLVRYSVTRVRAAMAELVHLGLAEWEVGSQAVRATVERVPAARITEDAHA